MTKTTGENRLGSHGYLDAASSEPLHPAAREVLQGALDAGFADPLRLHHRGRDARLLLDNARAVVASCLGAREDEVTFTSSGTQKEWITSGDESSTSTDSSTGRTSVGISAGVPAV